MLHRLTWNRVTGFWLTAVSRVRARSVSIRSALTRWLGLGETWGSLPLLARVYLLCVWSTGTVLVFWGAREFLWSLQQIAMVFLFASLIGGMDLFPVILRPGEGEITLSVPIGIAAIMLLPPPSIPLMAVVGTGVAEMRFTRPWYKKAFNIAQMVITYTTLAWVLRYIAGGDPLMLGSMRDVAAIVVVWVGHYALTVGLVTLAISLALSIAPFSVWRTNFRDVFYHEITLVPLGTILAVLMQYQPLAVVLVLPSLFALRQSFELTRELRRQTIDALLAFADSIDARDPSTYQHSQRVGELARGIARQMGLQPDEVDVIYLSARLHDLGKVGIGDPLLFKPGKLSEGEYDTIKEHPVIGAQIVQSFPIFGVGPALIRHHHEHYDGKGYPDGLSGEEIPLGARIIAVADAYDAMIADRPYRAGLPREVALQVMMQERGRQFDPEVVDAFLEVMGVAPRPLEGEAEDHEGPAAHSFSGRRVPDTSIPVVVPVNSRTRPVIHPAEKRFP